MKIFVLYATAGAGHRRAAEALYKALKNEPNFDTRIIDCLDYTNSSFAFFHSWGYIFLIAHLPSVWALIFYLTNSGWLGKPISYIRSMVDIINSARLRIFLIKENPDIIVSTHFLANAVCCHLKKKHFIKSRLISIVTDFNVHRFWLADNIDTYIVACEKTRDVLLKEGVDQDLIKVLGIPVDPVFSSDLNRDELCEKLSIKKDAFTVLILTSAVGIGPLENLANILKDKVQMLMVCGTNKRLFEKLRLKESPSLRVFGMVDNMHELMAVSSMIITKAGGLTTSEALVMRLPMVFLSLVPGQEVYNAIILSQYKTAHRAKNLKDINNLVLNYKNNPAELENMREAIDSVRRPHATADIVNLVKDYARG
ncbi:MAG: glycosyltransferase [Candidatus Omnitrophota bacterium]